jgi:hypothetical protein
MEDNPFTWEDFGLFYQYPGAMFGLGSRNSALHNPDYDFPDDIIRRFYFTNQQTNYKCTLIQ